MYIPIFILRFLDFVSLRIDTVFILASYYFPRRVMFENNEKIFGKDIEWAIHLICAPPPYWGVLIISPLRKRKMEVPIQLITTLENAPFCSMIKGANWAKPQEITHPPPAIGYPEPSRGGGVGGGVPVLNGMAGPILCCCVPCLLSNSTRPSRQNGYLNSNFSPLLPAVTKITLTGSRTDIKNIKRTLHFRHFSIQYSCHLASSVLPVCASTFV